MEEGEDFKQSFATVPRSTAGRPVIALAAANGRHLLAMDITQACIQACWSDLPEDISSIFIAPPAGFDKAEGVVYEVLRLLYGIPPSTRALHVTLARWFLQNKSGQAG